LRLDVSDQCGLVVRRDRSMDVRSSCVLKAHFENYLEGIDIGVGVGYNQNVNG
jgi:hypothetical protein